MITADDFFSLPPKERTKKKLQELFNLAQDSNKLDVKPEYVQIFDETETINKITKGDRNGRPTNNTPNTRGKSSRTPKSS